jgi:hypothetical protein
VAREIAQIGGRVALRVHVARRPGGCPGSRQEWIFDGSGVRGLGEREPQDFVRRQVRSEDADDTSGAQNTSVRPFLSNT